MKITMGARLRRLILVILVPMVIALAIVIGILVWYENQYEQILSNVTTASDFNQDFKNDVDLKMFYYVSESSYSEGIPTEEVESAKQLAGQLLETTTQANSRDAIESVKKLCETLEDRMEDVDDAQTYDDRMEELDDNIYILTELIQSYMSDYLYYESVHLSLLQYELKYQIRILLFVLICAVALMTVLLLIYGSRMSHSITKPLKKLSDRADSIAEGNLEPAPPIQAQVLEIQKLSDGFEEMVGRVNSLVEANKKAERRKRHAELELLQAQINPHFLYNTLDTIIWLIESENKEKSIEMVSALSQFFRVSLSRGQDVITLAQEQQHVLSYLQIQKTRYQDRMDYEINIPNSILEYRLPKLTLQPLVENSIYHGIKMKRGKGQINVTGKEFEDKILLIVTDTGAGMDLDRLTELRQAIGSGKKVGFGLRTVHERIQLLFGEEYGLSIYSTLGVGTTIIVAIPKEKMVVEENA